MRWHYWPLCGGPIIPWNDSNDLLILNLVSRKQFWLRRATLLNQIKSKKTGEEDEEDNNYDLRTDPNLGWFVREIQVETNEIVMKCKIKLKNDDWFLDDDDEEERAEDRRYLWKFLNYSFFTENDSFEC